MKPRVQELQDQIDADGFCAIHIIAELWEKLAIELENDLSKLQKDYDELLKDYEELPQPEIWSLHTALRGD